MQKRTKHSLETIEKMRISALKRDNTQRIKLLPKKENHWNWKDKPNKLTLHKRIHRQHGRASDRKCVECKKQARDWALVGKEYSWDIKDYKPMCRLCHTKMDKPWLKRKTIIIARNKKGQIVKSKHTNI